MEGGDSEFANFTLPTLKAFLEDHSQNVWQQAITCYLCYRMPQNAFFSWNRDLLISQKMMQRHFFFHPPSPFSSNFCNCNSGGICTTSQFYFQLLLLYTAWSSAYSEISLEVMLRPLVTSCAKDYKGHSLMQTSFIEPPKRVWWVQELRTLLFIICGCQTFPLLHLEWVRV